MNCPVVIPSQQVLSIWQKAGLNLVSRLHGGRDLVFAVDLTESVGLNDEGRIRLHQIIEDSLQKGDTVYIIPFAREVPPLETGIKYTGKKEDITKILALIPLKADQGQQNADIQKAELEIYKGLAQLNQCSLYKNKPIKPQSVVWLTDAPLFTSQGITSNEWIETPANSPFRVANSQPSIERKTWLNRLPLKPRSRTIISDKNEPYDLTVVDLPATVQEFCTPAPGGKETCLVTPYLIQQLWLPSTLLTVLIIAISFGLKTWLSWQKRWELKIDFYPHSLDEEKRCYLANQKRIYIGEDSPNSIELPGAEVRGYLERKGNRLFIVPLKDASPLYLRGQEITQRTLLTGEKITLTVEDSTHSNREIEILINLKK